jgi:hypothetical protein
MMKSLHESDLIPVLDRNFSLSNFAKYYLSAFENCEDISFRISNIAKTIFSDSFVKRSQFVVVEKGDSLPPKRFNPLRTGRRFRGLV